MMMKHAVGTAVAAVFATAMVGAQTTGAGSAAGEQTQRASGQQQMVTVVGCLQRDATVTADAGDRTFMLVSAEVRSGDTATGTAGQQGAQPGTQQPGTQQPGSQAGQPGQQPGTQPGQQADTATGTSGVAGTTGMAAAGNKFKVTGLDDERLRQYEGQRVQIQGTIEDKDKDRTDGDSTKTPGQYGTTPGQAGTTPGQTDATTGQAGTTPGQAGTTPGQAGTTPGQAGTTPGQAGQSAQHGDHTRAAAGDVKELKATSIQASAGTCPPQAAR